MAENKSKPNVPKELSKARGKNVQSAKQAQSRKSIIPKGFTYLGGARNLGYTVLNPRDGSKFVWIPVDILEADGAIDESLNFTEKFGRRNFGTPLSNFIDTPCPELEESIKKFGGFYVSSCIASQRYSRPIFVKSAMPWTSVGSLYRAETLAKNYATPSMDVASCLPNGAVYDTIFKWLIQTRAASRKKLMYDSTTIGNYWNSPNSMRTIQLTGSREIYCLNGIYDIAGNVFEYSNEFCSDSSIVLRGGDYGFYGPACPAIRRFCDTPISQRPVGFRVILYFKP